MPSVLIETGFITNKSEGAYLNSSKGQSEMAQAIADAIITYQKNIRLTSTDTQFPEITKDELEDAIQETQPDSYPNITFKVQIAASSKRLKTKPYNFKGLQNVSRHKEGNLYKYYYGSTSDYHKIQLQKTYAQEKGFTNCFVVAFKDGNKITLAEALKTKTN